MAEMSMNQFVKIVAEQLGVDATKIAPDAHMINDLGADSLAMVNIVAEVEAQLDVEFDDLELDDVLTVQDAYDKMCQEL